MSLKDYFEMGRKREIEHENKQKAKMVIKKIIKPSPFSLSGIVMGLGVLYQILYPMLIRLKPKGKRKPSATMEVVRSDIKMVVMKIRGINPEWEKFKRWEELAKGKKE
jgi:hypothetical protein